MAKAEFTKGQGVYVYNVCYATANVTYKPHTVASCGAKQMYLLREDGSNARVKYSAPFRGENRYQDVQCATVDPVAHAATLRKQFAARIAAHFAACEARAAELLSTGSVGARGYAAAIADKKARFEHATADLRQE